MSKSLAAKPGFRAEVVLRALNKTNQKGQMALPQNKTLSRSAALNSPSGALQLIAECHCGCEMRIFKGARGGLYLTSAVQLSPEHITYVDKTGFINGKYSATSRIEQLIRKELKCSPHNKNARSQ